MKMKIISKVLVIGIIILLLSATSLLVLAERKETNNIITNTRTNVNNSLGLLRIIHKPFLFRLGIFPIEVYYYPPEDNPTFDYYFPQDENGFVYINFTLHISHIKDSSNPYFTPYRFTGIKVRIGDGVEDYIVNQTIKLCYTFYYTYYNISLISAIPLYINNITKAGRFYLEVFPIPSFRMKPSYIWIDFCKTLFGDLFVDRPIFIHPVI